MELLYLASPYTHADESVMEKRHLETCYAARDMMTEWRNVYSPILHNHFMAKMGGLPVDFDYWMNVDFDMIKRCDALVVLMLDGWEDSKGIKAEVDFATSIGLKVHYIKPDWMNR